jgi:hypothetical protein
MQIFSDLGAIYIYGVEFVIQILKKAAKLASEAEARHVYLHMVFMLICGGRHVYLHMVVLVTC